MSKKVLFGFIKKHVYLILLILIPFLFVIPLLKVDFFQSHDGVSQIIRISAFYKSIMDGQFPIRWAGDLNYGYGSPTFIFYYSLIGYFGVFMHLLGFSFENGYKILCVFIYLLSPITFYLWSKELFAKRIAFFTALFYVLGPYSFLNLYVRGHLGEMLALAIIPLVLLFAQRNVKKIQSFNIIFGAFFYALLIHAHGILSIIFTFIFICYFILLGLKNKKLIYSNLLIILLGLMLSAYFWIPAMIEAKYINSELFVRDFYKDHFLNIYNIIYSRWGFGANVNKFGGLSAQIGPIYVLFFTISLILFKKMKNKLQIIFWIFIFAWGVFMSTKVSDLLWKNIHLLQQFQFPWRFSSVGLFSSSVLAGFIFTYLKNNRLLSLTLIIIIIFAIPMTKVIEEKPRGDAYYLNNPTTASFHNEATTIWVQGDAYKYPKSKLELIGGRAKITDYFRKSNFHKFKIDAETNAQILDNTEYFPGWIVKIDGKKVPIEFQDMNHRGFITFYVPHGKHDISIIFQESPVRLIADIISIIGIISVILYLFVSKRKIIKTKL